MQSTQDAWIKEVHRFSNGGQTESRRSFPVVPSISGEKNNRVNTLQTGTACIGTPLFNGWLLLLMQSLIAVQQRRVEEQWQDVTGIRVSVRTRWKGAGFLNF